MRINIRAVSFYLIVFLRAVSVGQAQERMFPTYTGTAEFNEQLLDGGIPWAIGVHSYGVFRAFSNQGKTHDKDGLGYQFNHHPDIVYWKDHYWVSYQGGPTDGVEGDKPRVPYLITYSTDGMRWEAPELLFPSIKFQDDFTYMHARMGFHVTTKGKLLALSFHGRHKTPNGGGDNGVARVVREIYGVGKDGRVNLGPVYAIRFNKNRSVEDTGLQHYTSSKDQAFVEACDELLNNKLVTQQWFEEDRSTEFHTANMNTPNEGPDYDGRNTECKAFAWYTLPSGRIIGWWKGAAMAYSDDGWKTVSNINIDYNRLSEHRTAKIWGERMSRGNYAFVFCLNTRPASPKTPVSAARSPLVVISSRDGLLYDSDRAVIFGDIAPSRYINPPIAGGLNDNRDGGAQYVRGISESNKNKPNTTEPTGDMWLTYSVNKEDIWVSRVPKDIRYTTDQFLSDDFQRYDSNNLFGDWIILSPSWAPVTLGQQKRNRFMRLHDKDPYDYAKAMRVFPASAKVRVRFLIRSALTEKSLLNIDITDRNGNVAARLQLDSSGFISVAHKDALRNLKRISPEKWIAVDMRLDAETRQFDLTIAGKKIDGKFEFFEDVKDLERFEIRTGKYRMNDFDRIGMWKAYPEFTFSDADEELPNAIFDLDELTITPY